MIGKRQLTISDYAAMARRWASVLVIPAAIAALAAFLLSYSFTPQYTSQTVMLVHGQTVPEGFVKPGLTQELSQRVANIEAQVLSRNRLQAIAERYGLLGEQSAGEVLTEMRKKIVVSPVQTDFTPPSRGGKPAPITSFSISYTGSNPATAQKVCNDLA